jgi:cbb3-type cytochrome oxidase subunit 3
MPEIFTEMHTWMLVLMVALFAAIVAWAYSSRRRKGFEEASRIPLRDDDR